MAEDSKLTLLGKNTIYVQYVFLKGGVDYEARAKEVRGK